MIELTNKLASAERCIEIAEEQLKEHEGVDDNLANMIAKMRVQTQNEFQRYQNEADAAFQAAVSYRRIYILIWRFLMLVVVSCSKLMSVILQF